MSRHRRKGGANTADDAAVLGRFFLFTLCCFATVVLVVVGSVVPASASPPTWWSGAYTHRLGITIMTSDALPSGYSVSVTLNHSAMVSEGMSLASGNDVRIVQWNGSTWTELDRVLSVGSSWNNPATKLYFRTQSSVGASSTDISYYAYYGNALAGAPPANADNVYNVFDDFSGGALNPAKWTTYTQPGTSVVQSGGEVVASGTPQSGTSSNYTGIYSAAARNPGVIIESTVRVVTNASTGYKAKLGLDDPYAALRSNGTNVTLSYIDSPFWYDFGASTLPVTTFGAQRISESWATDGVVRHVENGTFIGQRSSGLTAAHQLNLGFTNSTIGAPFDFRIDDVVVRKYVTNEPITILESSSDVTIAAVVDAWLTFGVASHVGACNGISQSAGVATSAVAVGLGHVSVSGVVGAQDVTISTNSGLGYAVYLRHTAALQSPAHTLAAVPGSNASPGAFPLIGTEAFGYTTDDATLATGTADRFTNGGAKWAALTGTNSEIEAGSTVTSGDIACIAFRAQVSGTSPAGAYSTSIIYTAIPAF